MPTGQALAVVVASRILLIVSDLLLAGVATLIDRVVKAHSRSARRKGALWIHLPMRCYGVKDRRNPGHTSTEVPSSPR